MTKIDSVFEEELDEMLDLEQDAAEKPWFGKVSTGKIGMIFPHDKGCYILMKTHSPSTSKPTDAFFLQLDHPNYQSLYALILDAAIKKRSIKFRTTVDIDSTPRPPVMYVTVNY